MKKIDDVLVLKIGTSTLTKTRPDGSIRLDTESFERIGRQIRQLQASCTSMVVVSSAAITAGMAKTGLALRPSKGASMPELQRLASIGWHGILSEWQNALGNNHVGSLLLTRHELAEDSERNEALRVIHTLLSHGDIPVINENDAITHEEIAFGDNDMLAANLAARFAHSTLFACRVRMVVLSDVDGVYADRHDPSTVIANIDNLAAYKHLAGGNGSPNGSGGMQAKFMAAEIATAGGVDMWIVNGQTDDAIRRALNDEIGTHFTSAPSSSITTHHP